MKRRTLNNEYLLCFGYGLRMATHSTLLIPRRKRVYKKKVLLLSTVDWKFEGSAEDGNKSSQTNEKRRKLPSELVVVFNNAHD